MLVEMHLLVRAAGIAEQLECAVRNDLVGVHVRRGAGATLDHVHAEVLVVPVLLDLARGAHDGVADRLIQQAERHVRARGRFFHLRVRDDQFRKIGERDARDRKVLHRAQGLHTVERGVGYEALAEEIVFLAGRAAEAWAAPSSGQDRVGATEPFGDRARGPGHEGRVQRWLVPQDRFERFGAKDDDCRGEQGACRRTVRLRVQ